MQNDIEVTSISGATVWEEFKLNLPDTSGTYTLKWEYSKDASGSDGSDCGWVDSLAFYDSSFPVTYAVAGDFTTSDGFEMIPTGTPDEYKTTFVVDSGYNGASENTAAEFKIKHDNTWFYQIGRNSGDTACEYVWGAISNSIITTIKPGSSYKVILTIAEPPVVTVAEVTAVLFQSAVQTGGTSGTTDYSTGLILTFDIDPTTLSADNITVTGATKGTLSGSGTTRTLGISDITVANEATVSVEITSPSGYLINGSLKNAVVYNAIGTPYQGGVIAYTFQSGEPGYVSGETHGLIASTADLSTGIQWYNGSNTTTGATGTALGTGQANTTAIVTNQGAGSYAAQLCDDYTNTNNGTGVYSDWYLPSKDELNKLYLNSTSLGVFANDYYWSSSEDGSNYAWFQYFYDGYQYSYYKDYCCRVRAVRAF